MEPSKGGGGKERRSNFIFWGSLDSLEHGFKSCIQNSVTAAVPDMGGILFIFFAFPCQCRIDCFGGGGGPFSSLLCYLLSSCKFPKGRGFHYFPWEAISYQDVPTDTRLSFSLLLHTPFCFTLEGFSLPRVYTSWVSVCNQTSILVITYLALLISALVVCQSFQQNAQFSCYLSFVFRLKSQLVQFLHRNYVCFKLVSTPICCLVFCLKRLLSVIHSFRYPYQQIVGIGI